MFGVISIIALAFKYLPETFGMLAVVFWAITIIKAENNTVKEIAIAGITLGLISALTAILLTFAHISIFDYYSKKTF